MTGADLLAGTVGGVIGALLVHLIQWAVWRVRAWRRQPVLRPDVLIVPRVPEHERERALDIIRALNARAIRPVRPPRTPDLPC